MRVFAFKSFKKWATREGIPDKILLKAAKEIVAGQVEADLGKGLFKKRLAGLGKGKRGGFRLIVAYKRPNSDRIIFIFNFAKADTSNLNAEELKYVSVVAKKFLEMSDEKFAQSIQDGFLVELEEQIP